MTNPVHHHTTAKPYTDIANPLRRASFIIFDWLDLLIYTLVGVAFIGAAALALGFSIEHLLLNFGVMLPLSGVVQTTLCSSSLWVSPCVFCRT